MLQSPAVITLDGSSGSGKGTISDMVAKKLGWHRLDSGLLYRGLALKVEALGISADDQIALTELAKNLSASISHDAAFIQEARSESVAQLASKISVWPDVRAALVEKQRDYLRPPGLVADGRDMGTVIFPEASCKFYLEADLLARANRRLLELRQRGLDGTLEQFLQGASERDERDKQRKVAPLRPAPDAIFINTTNLSIEQVFTLVWRHLVVKLKLNL